MKFLNLNKLSKVSDRALTINEVSYPVKSMSVEDFIEITRAAQKMVDEGTSLVDQIEAAVGMICRLVPTVPKEELVKYDLAMLNTISEFVRGDNVDEQEEVEEAGEAGK